MRSVEREGRGEECRTRRCGDRGSERCWCRKRRRKRERESRRKRKGNRKEAGARIRWRGRGLRRRLGGGVCWRPHPRSPWPPPHTPASAHSRKHDQPTPSKAGKGWGPPRLARDEVQHLDLQPRSSLHQHRTSQRGERMSVGAKEGDEEAGMQDEERKTGAHSTLPPPAPTMA